MSDADIAQARRYYMHVQEGGTLTARDVGRMVEAMEVMQAKLAQQDDLVQAAVAAALREVANIACASFDEQIGYDEILAFITPDAQAALDRYVAEALREAADAVEDYCSNAPDLAGHGHSGAIRDVITAIRKGGE